MASSRTFGKPAKLFSAFGEPRHGNIAIAARYFARVHEEAEMSRLFLTVIAAVLVAVFSFTASAQTPAPQTQPAPIPAPPATPADPIGAEVTLEPKTFVYMKGTATWESAFETLIEAFKTINDYLAKQKITPSDKPLAIYTQTDESGFQYQVGIPVAEAPKNPPRGDLAVAKSPGGKMLQFVHRGSYDAMDTTYEAITNYLDEKRLESEDMFIEEYVTDPVKTPEDKLIVNVYVPLK
jgi:effector-binding domain-containing protein